MRRGAGPLEEGYEWCPPYDNDKPNADRALQISIPNKIPSNVLGRAKDTLTHKHNSGFFDGTYLTCNPEIWAEQQIGLACATHLGEHILNKITRPNDLFLFPP